MHSPHQDQSSLKRSCTGLSSLPLICIYLYSKSKIRLERRPPPRAGGPWKSFCYGSDIEEVSDGFSGLFCCAMRRAARLLPAHARAPARYAPRKPSSGQRRTFLSDIKSSSAAVVAAETKLSSWERVRRLFFGEGVVPLPKLDDSAEIQSRKERHDAHAETKRLLLQHFGAGLVTEAEQVFYNAEARGYADGVMCVQMFQGYARLVEMDRCVTACSRGSIFALILGFQKSFLSIIVR